MMSTKSKHTGKILCFLLSVIAFLALAVIIIPPQITLNNLKPKIENVILTKTGIPAKIHGDVNFSLLGKAAIVAHNISVPNGVASSIEFTVPFFDIFNLTKAEITGDIYVNGASIYVEKIVPFEINNNIILNDSKMKFLNKEYNIIHAELSKNNVDAYVRTDQHKYEIKSINNNFIIKNKNNDLVLTGELLKDGTVRGHISIIAQNVNRWFEFKEPKINGQFPITADVIWDGNYGIKFYNISADKVTGSIELKNDGYKIIDLKSDNADFDMSFFMKNPTLLRNASFNLNFYGDMTFMNKKINHIIVDTIGFDNFIKINKIIADDIQIIGGTVDNEGAHDVHVSGTLSGLHTTCLFNGTPTNWYCKEYSHGNNITSVFSVKDDVIDADVYSTAIYADMKPFVVTIRKLASSGVVRFYYPDMVGTLYLKKDSYTVDYTRLDNKSLNQAKINLKFLPEFMRDEPGDFVWTNGVMIFTPKSKKWVLSKNTKFFMLRGENFKHLTKKLDFQSVNDLSYIISGYYKNDNISDLNIEIADHKFTGNFFGNSLTLKTDILNIDSFANKYFIDNFEDLSFFTNHPILLPFDTGINISLTANKLIYKNQEYNNFVYSLYKNTQTFSISDSDHGNLLATINKNNIKYAIDIQLNKFLFNKKLLPENMPLNVSDTAVTAEIKLNTYGKIAHDIKYNIKGTFDASFKGGKLYGLGLSEFYASAPKLTTLNADKALSNALSGGISQIKKMHIVGTYESGDIKTSVPLSLSLPHTDATGIFEIKNNEMTAQLKLILRGTSAGPEPIDLIIYPNDIRDFSLSQIMMHFDPDYMREFVLSHEQF